MRPLTLAQIARWCEARVIGLEDGPQVTDMQAANVQAVDVHGTDVQVLHVGTDTRSLRAGSLYVALRGERVDGHDYVDAAAAAGAVALLVAREVDSPLPQLLCGDPEQALGELAAGVQQPRGGCVIGLTGSNGKTTVKTVLHGILAIAATAAGGVAYANPGNRNNEIGLPLAVLDAPEDAAYAVYEMGAGKPGDIAYLASIARPHIGLVNNVAPAHLQRMGTLLGIAQTKGALYEALPPDGVAVINADDAFAPYFAERAGARRQLRFGLEHGADVRASGLRLEPARSQFRLHTPAGNRDVMLPLSGRHNVLNALAASALAMAAGASLDAIGDGLARARPVSGRQVAYAIERGVTLIDDSYNANPGSVAAAIATLAGSPVARPAGAAWLVLGDMAELGETAELLHAETGDRARRAGIARLFTVGLLSRAASRAFGDGGVHFDSRDALVQALRDAIAQVDEGHPVRCLVKGSRSSAMDAVVAALRIGAPADASHPPSASESGHAA